MKILRQVGWAIGHVLEVIITGFFYGIGAGIALWFMVGIFAYFEMQGSG